MVECAFQMHPETAEATPWDSVQSRIQLPRDDKQYQNRTNNKNEPLPIFDQSSEVHAHWRRARNGCQLVKSWLEPRWIEPIGPPRPPAGPQEAPKKPQEAPKRPKTRPQGPRNGPQEASRGFKIVSRRLPRRLPRDPNSAALTTSPRANGKDEAARAGGMSEAIQSDVWIRPLTPSNHGNER